ncbi:hypothetical protein D3C80_2134740 [compost metagenome]
MSSTSVADMSTCVTWLLPESPDTPESLPPLPPELDVPAEEDIPEVTSDLNLVDLLNAYTGNCRVSR